MKHKLNERSFSGVAALVLLCVFAAGVLTVLLGGAQVYRRLLDRDQAAYTLRTCTQMISTKVRQAPGPVFVESFGGADALTLPEEIDGTVYLDRIYCHDGWLMELYAADQPGWLPEDGEKLLELDRLELAWDGELLCVTVDDTDAQATFCLQPRIHTEDSYEP